MAQAANGPQFAPLGFVPPDASTARRQQLAQLSLALSEEPLAVIGVLEYWLGESTSEGTSHVNR